MKNRKSFPKNFWYPVLEASKVKNKPTAIERFNENLVIWKNSQRQIFVMKDACPHRGASLSSGKVINENIKCPFHGFEFSASGECSHIPANGCKDLGLQSLKVKRYPSKVFNALIWVYFGDGEKVSQPSWFNEKIISGFDLNRVSGSSQIVDMDFYTWMENKLDMYHFPFVHKSTNRKKVGHELNPYRCDVTGDLIYSEGVLGKSTFKLHVMFPNLFYYELDSKIRAVVASCPINDQKTWFHAFYNQNYINFPILSRLTTFLLRKFALGPVLNQDLQIHSQMKYKPVADFQGQFVPRIDRAMAEYQRKWVSHAEG